MKTIILLLLAPFLCSGAVTPPANADFSASLKEWQAFKKKCSNTYYYKVEFVSASNILSVTTIIVNRGEVTGRYYEMYEGDTDETPIGSWAENKNNLGSHIGAAEPSTLDEIYQRADSNWLRGDKNKKRVYFEANNNGMISLCGYSFPLDDAADSDSNHRCRDHELTGIRITAIHAGKPADITIR